MVMRRKESSKFRMGFQGYLTKGALYFSMMYDKC